MKLQKFKSAIVENSEVLIDQIINDGILKDIPLIRNIITLYNMKASISEKITYQKIIEFYDSFSSVNQDDLENWNLWAEKNIQEQQEISKKICLYIESQNEIAKCRILGHLFKQLIEKEVTREEFEYFVHVISSTPIQDLKKHCIDGGDISQKHECYLSQRLQPVGFYQLTPEFLKGETKIEYEISEKGIKFIDLMIDFDWK